MPGEVVWWLGWPFGDLDGHSPAASPCLFYLAVCGKKRNADYATMIENDAKPGVCEWRERTAQTGGASVRCERTARAGGASGRREQGGASERRERATRAGGARGWREVMVCRWGGIGTQLGRFRPQAPLGRLGGWGTAPRPCLDAWGGHMVVWVAIW